jgi:hypothetical protein
VLAARANAAVLGTAGCIVREQLEGTVCRQKSEIKRGGDG